MFTQADLHDLLSFDAGSHKVVSLYLNTDAGQEPRETIKLRVRSLLKEAEGNYPQDAAVVEDYFDHDHDWSIRGLALFSCAESNFLRVFPTAVPFRNRVRIQRKPYVKPLAHLLDFYAHYGVILVDRVGACFFEYHLGELQAQDGIMGEDVHKTKDGQGSTAPGVKGGTDGGRQETKLVQRNLRQSADAAANFFGNKAIRRLFLGGTHETVSQFRDMLPKQLQSCIAGTFAIDLDAGEHEVRERTLVLLGEANAEREEKMVEAMVTAAAKNTNAVVGLNDTLHAVYEGRVKNLIISDGYRVPGYRYRDSGYLSAALMIDVPEAAGEPVEIDDVIEAAVEKTMAQGGHVEVISDNDELEKAGRIGAILRY